jgi:MoaA/NifB/PqqE/SkfB family radical SAM enzyme
MMPNSMELGKRFFGEKLLGTIMGYLKKDPEKNLEKVVDIVEKVAVLPNHKEYARNIKGFIQDNQATRDLIKRLISEVDENVQNHLISNFFINASLVGVPKQNENSKKLGYNIPYTVLIDPTSNCNLRCKGCWAGAYEKHNTLSFEEVDRIITEAKDLGIYFIALSGGEPTMWPHLSEICRRHNDVVFMIYTNGTLINEDTAKWMREAGNISPAISLEGGRETTDNRRGKGVYDKIMAGMDRLKEQGVIFGFSITITNENCEEAFSDDFIDHLIEKGALYGWSFHYIPIGSSPDFSLMISPEQRAALVDRVRHVRTSKPILIADFWNDGAFSNGCIAGGRRYFHITANGNVEPCAFIHFTVDNIKGKSLKEVLANPLFAAYQKRQPFSDNMLRPCPLIDVPEELRAMVSETDARPSYDGAEAVLYDQAAETMDKIAAAWKEKADLKWAELSKKSVQAKEEARL